MENRPLSLYELNALVRKSIRTCLPDAYWLQAELSDVRVNASGHCYVEFVQKGVKSDALVAKARGVIWNDTFPRLKSYFERETGQAFSSGMKVLVKVTADFHELYGYSLTVTDIDPSFTVGDMVRKRREILLRLEKEGVLTLNKELALPEFAQRVAVISSGTAAGYGDFCNQLLNNPFGFVFYIRLFPAVMQGERVESSVIKALETIYSERENWDVVVIIRGGGAVSDLSGFDTYDLAEHCAQFPLPIITGIGHERDDTVIDMISYKRVKTPTAAAEFLIGHLRETAAKLEMFSEFFRKDLPERLRREKERLAQIVAHIPLAVRIRMQHERFNQARLNDRMRNLWGRRVQEEIHRLALMEQQVGSLSPEHLLKRGYTLTLKNGMPVRRASQVADGDYIETITSDGKIGSIVVTNK